MADVPVIPSQTIRSFRAARSLTATDLAKRAGVDEWTVVRWERGRATPSRQQSERLVRILGIPTDRWEAPSTNGKDPEPRDKPKKKPRGKAYTGPEDPRYASVRKLSEEEVIEIRQSIEVGYADRELGRIYGVNQATIWSIRKGKTWAWLTEANGNGAHP